MDWLCRGFQGFELESRSLCPFKLNEAWCGLVIWIKFYLDPVDPEKVLEL